MKRSQLNLTLSARIRSAKAIHEIVNGALLDHLHTTDDRVGAGRILCTSMDLKELLEIMSQERMEWKDLIKMVKTVQTVRAEKTLFNADR